MEQDFSDEELLRYSRQIMLPQFDIAGQLRLKAARVLVVGLGGLGSPAAMYLAAAGVGELVLADFDRVELSNLQRQIAHGSEDIGHYKAESAQATLQSLNPLVRVRTVLQPLQGELLEEQVARVDAVMDCTDNFTIRFALNAACVKFGKPLISAAAIRLEGQISVFDPRRPESPCYHCLYADLDEEQLTCSQAGVMGPLVGVMGAMQALEAVKLLSGLGESLVGRLLVLDAMTLSWREFRIRRDPECPQCHGRTTADMETGSAEPG